MKKKLISLIFVLIIFATACTEKGNNVIEGNYYVSGDKENIDSNLNEEDIAATSTLQPTTTPQSTTTPKPTKTPTPTPILENYPISALTPDIIGVSSRVKENNPREYCWVYGGDMATELGVEKVLVWINRDSPIIYTKDARILDEFNRMLVEDYGCDFVVEFHDYAFTHDSEKYIREIEVMLNREEQIDIIAAGNYKEIYYWLVNNGIAEKWDVEFETKEGQIIKQAYPDYMWANIEYKGEIYGFSNKYITDYVNCFIADRQNTEKYDISIDENCTIYDIEQLLEGINVDKGVYPFVYRWDAPLQNCNYLMMNYLFFDKGSDGSYRAVNIAEEEEAIRIWETLHDYTEKGIGISKTQLWEENRKAYYNPDFIFMSDTIQSELLYNDRYFKEASNYTYDVGEECIIMNRDYIVSNRNYITCIAKESEYKEEALKLISLLATEEKLSNLLKYGIEGFHYTYVDGVIKENVQGSGKEPDIKALYNLEASTPRANEPENVLQYIEEYKECFISTPIDFLDEVEEKYGEQMEEIKGLITEYKPLFEGYEPDVRSKAAELSKKLKEAGIDEINAYINENLVDKINAY